MRKLFPKTLVFVFPSIMCFSAIQLSSQGIDGRGNCWMALENQNSTNSSIQVLYAPFGLTAENPITISDPAHYSENPSISVNSAGDAVVVWTTYNSQVQRRFLYASTFKSGGSWSEPYCLSSNDENVVTGYKVNISDNGNLSVAWNSCLDDGTYACSVRTGNASGEWNQCSRVLN